MRYTYIHHRLFHLTKELIMNRQMQPQGTNPYFNLRSARFTGLFLIALTVFNIVSYLSAAENASYTYFWFTSPSPSIWSHCLRC